MSTCQIKDIDVQIEVDECYKLIITDEKIEGKDSAYFSLAATKLPLVLSGREENNSY